GRPLSCAAKFVALHADGRLQSCELAARLAPEVPARVGAGVAFHPDGRLAGATIDRPLTVGGATVVPGTSVMWDASGGVVRGSVGAPTLRAGWRIQGEFELYRGGKPRAVELAAPARVQGHDFPQRARLQFRPDGTLERARYVEKSGFMIHGEEWRDTATVDYDRSGAETGRNVEHWQSQVADRRYDGRRAAP